MKMFKLALILVLLGFSLVLSPSVTKATVSQTGKLQPITNANASKVKLVSTLKDAKGSQFALRFNPSGDQLAAGAVDGSVRLWDVASSKLLKTFSGHSAQVAAVGFDETGKALLSAGYDKRLILWDVSSGNKIAEQTQNPKQPSQRLGVTNLNTTFSRDGKFLAYADDSGSPVYLWSVADQSQRQLTPANGQIVGKIVFSADAKMIAVTLAAAGQYGGKAVQLWNTADGKVLNTITSKDDVGFADQGLAISADGKLLAVVDTQKLLVYVYDVATGKQLFVYSGHKTDNPDSSGVYDVAFSPDGTVLATASYDKTIRLVDATSGKELAVLKSAISSAAVAFNKDGSVLATTGIDGLVEIWGAGS